MKLILSSNGLTTAKLRKEFSNMLEVKASEARIMVAHTVVKKENYIYLEIVEKELGMAGFKARNITYFNIAEKKDYSQPLNFDGVYVCGGNTFFILDRIRKTGLDKPLKDFVKSGKVYVGFSAGSIIMGKSIEIAGWGSEGDENEIGLMDLRGLGLTDIVVSPHYRDELKKELKEFEKKGGYKVNELKDGQAIVIDGKIVRKI
jgi:dipeptidase E